VALFFDGAHVFDGRSLKRRRGVLVDRGEIVWTGPRARAPRAAAGAREVPCGGRTLAPGLID
jgi:imidazolonepropionase-like amidohydrolase